MLNASFVLRWRQAAKNNVKIYLVCSAHTLQICAEKVRLSSKKYRRACLVFFFSCYPLNFYTVRSATAPALLYSR
jgi:hypothetical protein